MIASRLRRPHAHSLSRRHAHRMATPGVVRMSPLARERLRAAPVTLLNVTRPAMENAQQAQSINGIGADMPWDSISENANKLAQAGMTAYQANRDRKMTVAEAAAAARNAILESQRAGSVTAMQAAEAARRQRMLNYMLIGAGVVTVGALVFFLRK